MNPSYNSNMFTPPGAPMLYSRSLLNEPSYLARSPPRTSFSPPMSPIRLSPPGAPLMKNQSLGPITMPMSPRSMSPSRMSLPSSLPTEVKEEKVMVHLNKVAAEGGYLNVSHTTITGTGARKTNKIPKTAVFLGNTYPLNCAFYSTKTKESTQGARNFLTLYFGGDFNAANMHLASL